MQLTEVTDSFQLQPGSDLLLQEDGVSRLSANEGVAGLDEGCEGCPLVGAFQCVAWETCKMSVSVRIRLATGTVVFWPV